MQYGTARLSESEFSQRSHDRFHAMFSSGKATFSGKAADAEQMK
jgi:hypothetical protein